MLNEFLKIGFIIINTYFFSTFMGYSVHKMLHRRWAGFMNRAHMTHHLIKYPPYHLTSDEYRGAGKDNTLFLFAPIILAVLLIIVVMCGLGWISLFHSIFISLEILTISIIHEYIHTSFHLHKTIWKYVPGYSKMRELHFKHHYNMKKNFGIVDFSWDRLFKTIKD